MPIRSFLVPKACIIAHNLEKLKRLTLTNKHCNNGLGDKEMTKGRYNFSHQGQIFFK